MPCKSQTLHVNLAQCVEHKRILNQTRFINSCSHETLIARRRHDVQGVLIACDNFGMEVFGSPFCPPKSPFLFVVQIQSSRLYFPIVHIYSDEWRLNETQLVQSRMLCSFYLAINKHSGLEFDMVQKEEKFFYEG